MTKPSDIQALILSAAAQRPKHITLPIPETLRGGAATKVSTANIVICGWRRQSGTAISTHHHSDQQCQSAAQARFELMPEPDVNGNQPRPCSGTGRFDLRVTA
jgi:hypothetical protein